MGGFLAEAAGIEPIIGAFLSGLALNKFIPPTSALMNRIGFVGNAIFIPFFLVGVGMLVDVSTLWSGLQTLEVAAVITGIALLGKFLAAWITQKTFKLSSVERTMVFGLSSAQAAATLAAVLVGYNIILGETPDGQPIRLLNEAILNGTILMILVTCTVSSFMVEKASRKIALLENETVDEEEEKTKDKILISIAYPETINDLVDLALSIKQPKIKESLYALYVVDKTGPSEKVEKEGKKMMDAVIKQGASTDNIITPITRFDENISNGIIYTIKEKDITDLILGLHKKAREHEFIGATTQHVLSKSFETVYIYKPVQPFNTLKRIVVTVTPNAESEPGFTHWFTKVCAISRQTSLPVLFYADPSTIAELKNLNEKDTRPVDMKFTEFNDWDDFLILSREINEDDLFIIVSSRKGNLSYNRQLEKLPYYLCRYFKENSLIILYPAQLESRVSLSIPAPGRINEAGNFFKHILKRKDT